MKRYRIIVMVPHAKEVVVADVQAAHNEATKLVEAQALGDLAARVHTIEEIEDVPGDFSHIDPTFESVT